MGEPIDREPKGRPRAVAATGPRFDVRFEPDGGLLELAKPLHVAAAQVEALSLSLGRIRFPLAVGAGAARFRTKRTTARRLRVRIDLRALGALCGASGVRLRFAGVTPGGELRCVLVDGAGALAFEAMPLADGADLVFALRAARAATDGPAPALSRILAALRPLGAALDAESGLLRLRRPLRAVLREAMAGHGWRVPDERALRLAAPQLDDRTLLLATAGDASSATLSGVPARRAPTADVGSRSGDAAALADVALREDARLVAPVLVALEAADLDAARASLTRLVARGGTAVDRLVVRELVASLGVDAGDPRAGFELASLVAPTLALDDGDVPSASLAATLSLRLALRGGDADAAASAARRVDACEAAGELAAAALRVAACCFDESRGSARAELLTRAAARAPSDAALAAEAVAAAIAAEDLHAAETTARRALAELTGPSARLLVLRAAAAALGDALAPRRDTAAVALAPLWDEGLALAPDDPQLLAAASSARSGAGQKGAALALLDRAASSALDARELRLAASLLARAAALASALGRDDGAVERLGRAAALDPEEGSTLASLALTYERLGDGDEAAAAYMRLLARGPARAQVDGLLRAVLLHLSRTEPREARAFLEAARRVAPEHDALPALAAAVDAAIADGWASSPGSLRAIDVFALAGVARDASDPGAVVRAITDALCAPAPMSEVPALVAAGRLAAERLAPEEAALLLGPLADAVAGASEHVVDPSDLAALEPHARSDDARATIARRSAQLLRGAGQGGAAARALARAGVVRRDAATLRAAIDLAVRAEAWDDAASIVREALEVVGDGPARAQLAARAAAIAEKRRT